MTDQHFQVLTITAEVLDRAAEAYYETQDRAYDHELPPWSELAHDSNARGNSEEIALIVLQAAGLEIDRSLR